MAATGITTGGTYTGLTNALREVYSADINFEAQGVMRYEDACVKKSELAATKGQTVVFTTYSDIAMGSGNNLLSENTPIPTRTIGQATVSISIQEFGNGVAFSEKLDQMGWDNHLRTHAKLLGRDYAKSRDLYIRDTMVGGGQTFFSDETAAALVNIAADDTFDVEGIRRVVEYFETNNAPKFENDFYLCYIHPHQAADLMRDPDWISASNYHADRKLYNGELGRWLNVVFIQTSYQGNGAVADTVVGYEAALANTGAAGIDLYRATFLADQAIGLADALPVEIREGAVVDFGRHHQFAWYALYGAGILDSTHIVHMISA